MKKRVTLLVLVSLLVISVGVSAQDFEFVGGVTYSTFALTDTNEYIDYMNSNLDEAEEDDPDAEISKMDKMDSAIGFFAGVQKKINEEVTVGGQYERYSLDSNGSLELDPIEASIGLKLNLNALVGTVSYKVNDNFALNGGVGYYFGQYITEFKGYDPISDEPLDDPVKDESPVTGIGFKIGGAYNHQLKSDVSFTAAANYRILNLTYTEYEDAEPEDAGGFEISGGIAYGF